MLGFIWEVKEPWEQVYYSFQFCLVGTEIKIKKLQQYLFNASHLINVDYVTKKNKIAATKLPQITFISRNMC